MEILHSDKITEKASTSPTQKYLDVAEIKENVVVLKNGAFRCVLAVSAINYELKSTDEQDAIVSHYQNFLNSVDFPIQILISSRRLNMDNYLEFLSEKEKVQSNELLRFQISEYRNFISQLVGATNIMDKNFYIVVPFSPVENQEKGFWGKMFSFFNPKKEILEKRENFETVKSQLFQRAEHIIAGLAGIGLRIVPLETQELIELLFNAYNPSVYNAVTLSDSRELEIK